MSRKQSSTFEAALTDAALSRYQSILAQENGPVQLSAEYRAATARLTRKAGRRTWKYVNTAWKRVLVAILIAILLAATVFAAVPALREEALGFFLHDSGTAYSFTFPQDALDRTPRRIETRYAPGFIPDGYAMTAEHQSAGSFMRIYQSHDGLYLTFTQSALRVSGRDGHSPASGFTVNSENVRTQSVCLGGHWVLTVEMDNLIGSEDAVYLWTDGTYFYALNVPDLDTETVSKIIGSIHLIALDPSDGCKDPAQS